MRRKRKSLAPDTPLAPVPSEILDRFVRQGPISHEELEAAVRRFKKAIIERALRGELTHQLGYPPGGTKPAIRPIIAMGRATKRSRPTTGRSQGHERGARRRLSADHAADVHRAPDSPQPRLR